MDSIWPLVTVLGPLLLIGTLIWVTVRNSRAPRASFERAERGAKQVREEIAREDRT